MAKDPAFLFYSQDFYTGTATLSFEDRGKFITILCLMHQQGRMKEETIRFLVGSVSDTLRLKFKVDENGFWYNERLEAEATKRAEFTESRRINGSLGGRPKKTKPNGKPSANLMGNENGNVIVNKNSIEQEIFSDELFIADLSRMHKGKNLKKAWDECFLHHSQGKTKYEGWEWRQKLNTWLINTKEDKGLGKNWQKVH